MVETPPTGADAARSIAASGNRARIVAAATQLLTEGGREAVSSRAVCAAAGVQPPTLYRLFGDKRGLLDAVAAHGFARYVHPEFDSDPDSDPVEILREGWDGHVSFGLANPYLYPLIYGDPRPDEARQAADALAAVVAHHVHRIALAGRLRMGEELATRLMLAAGTGTTLSLIGTLPKDRDPALSAASREAVITAITTDTPSVVARGPVGAAVALRAGLPAATSLSERERGLLGEWLDRIAGS